MTPAAKMQGRNRFDRGRIYYGHLIDEFGPEIKENQKLRVVKDAGHDYGAMVLSLPCRVAVLSKQIKKEAKAISVQLKNPDFESKKLHEGWTLYVHGAQPTLAMDTKNLHKGRQSLRVSASKLSDTAFGQEVEVSPGQLYRLTGWVKTRNLESHGSPVFGTFRIGKSGGRGLIAQGRNHSGDTEWTQETILFYAPLDGRVQIGLFFVGFGKGSGTVWFDAVRLEQVSS